jgi:lia operon protein LiaF
MRDKGALFIGIVLVILGALFLISNLLEVNFWPFCWPTALIAVGAWMILRPRMISPDTALEQKLLGEISRDGVWEVKDEELWVGIGDVELDMTRASIPLGETRLRVFGLVGGLEVLAPEQVGISIASTAFVTDGKVFGKQQERFAGTLDIASDDYETAERRVRIEVTRFATSLKVRRV